MIGPYTDWPSFAVDPTIPPTELGGPTICVQTFFIVAASIT